MMKPEDRELMTLRMLYEALPKREIEEFTRAACPSSFAAMYDTLRENLKQRMSGVYGGYGIKLALDVLVAQGSIPDSVLSRWPSDCPGYQASLATLFPGLQDTYYLQALYWVHMKLSEKWRLLFPESCAQLCWDHRRVSGNFGRRD